MEKAKGLCDTVTSQHMALTCCESDNFFVNSLSLTKFTQSLIITL